MKETDGSEWSGSSGNRLYIDGCQTLPLVPFGQAAATKEVLELAMEVVVVLGEAREVVAAGGRAQGSFSKHPRYPFEHE